MDESCITSSTWVQQCFRDNRMLLLKDKCTCRFPSFSTLLSGLLQQGVLSFYDNWYGAGQSLIWESQSPWTLYPTDSPLIMMCSWLIELLISLILAIKKKHCVWWMRSTHWFWFTSIYFNHSLMETFLDEKVTLWPPFIWQFWVEQVCGCMCNGIQQSWGPP